mgnify:CR=1 FL=1
MMVIVPVGDSNQQVLGYQFQLYNVAFILIR